MSVHWAYYFSYKPKRRKSQFIPGISKVFIEFDRAMPYDCDNETWEVQSMQSLYDYVRWLGRFSFDELPMSAADAIVLCVISYFDLAPALHEGTGLVSDCAARLDDGSLSLQITGGDMGNSGIFRAAVNSKRFGEIRITDYVDILEPQTPLQFSAVTFRWGDSAFIAFRGTDETIAGWREDFMISFAETQSQKLARAYAERVIDGSSGHYCIGGHSKGGNLVLYAALGLSAAAWAQVDHLFLLDGPGLCPEVMDTSAVERVYDKTTRIIPEFSVIGRLFEPRVADTRIVHSSASGIMEHSLATWQVDYGPLAEVSANDRTSNAMMDVLNRWISGMSQEDRRILTDDIFDALSAGGAVTLREIAGGGPGGFEVVLSRIFHTRDATKKIMKELPAQMMVQIRRQLGLGDAE